MPNVVNLKKLSCKMTLRQVFYPQSRERHQTINVVFTGVFNRVFRVYRLEIQSAMLFFSLRSNAPLTFSLVSSSTPSSLCEVYSVYLYSV
jgi:hypothetical protein